MKYIKRFFIFVILTTIAILFVFIALPVSFFCLFGLLRFLPFLLYSIARWWAKLIIVMSGATVRISGMEHIPAKGPVCFVSNHCGIFDIVLCLAVMGRPFGFIAKKELAFIPFLNLWILLLGGLFIERKNPRKALKTIAKAVGRIKKGGAMLIFPEGTRSKGRGLLPFKSGALKMAVESGAVIVPVAIYGSYDVFEKTGFVRPAATGISFGKQIDQAGFTEHKRHALSAAAHEAVARMLADRESAD